MTALAVALSIASCVDPTRQPSGGDSSSADSSDSDDSTAPGPDDSVDSGDSGACTELTWYRDGDGDGRGDPAVSVLDCDAPVGFVADATDCDDTHAEAYSGAVERWTDGIDDDCDGAMSRRSVTELSLWQVLGSYQNTTLGVSVATGGDFNSDGHADLAVGGSAGELDGGIRGGTVVVFNGPLASTTSLYDESSANVVMYGGRWDATSTVCAAGDLDGDGTDDLVVGAPSAANIHTGIAYVVRGPLVGVIDLTVDTQSFSGTDGGDTLGMCAGPGDVDGDGLNDLVISESESGGDDGIGSVYLFRGPAEQESVDDADQILRGSVEKEYIGYRVAALHDLNGDGTADYGIANAQVSPTSPDGVSAYVITEYTSGVLHPRDAGVTLRYDLASAPRSLVVTGVGDINEDGYADLALGTDSSTTGAVLSVLEGPVGAEAVLDVSASASVSFESSAGGPNRWLSFATSLGDWNGDGHGVVAIADAEFTPDEVLAEGLDCSRGDDACAYGAIYLIAQPIEPGVHDLATEADRLEGAYSGGYMGGSDWGPALAGGTDLNDDGFPDLAFGASSATTSASHSGTAYVLFGGGSP